MDCVWAIETETASDFPLEIEIEMSWDLPMGVPTEMMWRLVMEEVLVLQIVQTLKPV